MNLFRVSALFILDSLITLGSSEMRVENMKAKFTHSEINQANGAEGQGVIYIVPSRQV